MFDFIKLPIAAILVAAITLMSAGCGVGTVPHPNQLSAFDGAVYDTLTVAHSALTTLGVQVKTSYPNYTAEYNTAVQAYDVAYNSYALYRSSPTSDTTLLTAQVMNITVAVAALESAIQKDMGVPPAVVASIRAKVIHVRNTKFSDKIAGSDNFSVADLLTELEIAAQVAQTIPAAAPYAALASLVIQVTAEAISAFDSSSGDPINLATIAPLPVLSVSPATFKAFIKKHDVALPVRAHGLNPVLPSSFSTSPY